MNAKTNLIRILLALVIVLSFLGLSTKTALADKPIKGEYTWLVTSTYTNICPFEITLTTNVQLTQIILFDKDGNVPRVNQYWVNQDTFTANGKTLIGLPFAYHTQLIIDPNSGDLLHMYSAGIIEKVPLPDGKLFISAGRLDWVMHSETGFIISINKEIDHGRPGNLDAFCAALTP